MKKLLPVLFLITVLFSSCFLDFSEDELKPASGLLSDYQLQYEVPQQIKRIPGKTLFTLTLNGEKGLYTSMSLSDVTPSKAVSTSDSWEIKLNYKSDTDIDYQMVDKTAYRIENGDGIEDLTDVSNDNISYYTVNIQVTNKETGEHIVENEEMLKKNVCLVASRLNTLFTPIYEKEIAMLRPEGKVDYTINEKEYGENKFRVVFAYFGEKLTVEDSSYMGGYYSPRDEQNLKDSNKAEVIYLNLINMLYGVADETPEGNVMAAPNRLLTDEEVDKLARNYLATLCHEFCHFLQFDYAIDQGLDASTNVLTFIEGLANYISLKFRYDEKGNSLIDSSNIYYHIIGALSDTASTSMFIKNGFVSFGQENSTTYYGMGCLFMSYLAEMYGNGFEKEMVKLTGSIAEGLPALFGMSLDELFEDFLLQLFYSFSDVRPAGYGKMNFAKDCGLTKERVFAVFSDNADSGKMLSPYTFYVKRWSEDTTVIQNNSKSLKTYILWLDTPEN